MIKTGYKLFRLRKDGSLGSLFIGARAKLPQWQWLQAECIPTKGFKVRPGWHIVHKKYAPHLSTKGRVWAKVKFYGYEKHQRPENQGGLWFTADWIKICEVYK